MAARCWCVILLFSKRPSGYAGIPAPQAGSHKGPHTTPRRPRPYGRRPLPTYLWVMPIGQFLLPDRAPSLGERDPLRTLKNRSLPGREFAERHIHCQLLASPVDMHLYSIAGILAQQRVR
jgi:hypothetical protein